MTRLVHIIKATGIAGAEQHLLTLLPALDRERFEIRLIVLTEPRKPVADFFSALRAADVLVERVIIRGDADPTLAPRLALRLRALAPVLVHTHLVHADFHGTLAARLAGVPLVISTRHNDDPYRRRWPLSSLLRIINRRTDHFVAISEHVRAFTIEAEHTPESYIDTVNYGLAAGVVNRPVDVRAEFGIPVGPLLVCVARLTAQKGHRWLLPAFRAVVDEFPQATLLLLGDGPLRRQLEQMSVQLGLRESVRFAGWRTDVSALLPGTDLFVLASEWEGFGLALLEAMAAALPIVATRVGAIPEVVLHAETGWLVAAKNATAFADKTISALRAPEQMVAFGHRGRARLDREFSVKRMVAATERLYVRMFAHLPDSSECDHPHRIIHSQKGVKRDAI
ncbi:MAG: glycosyltransferase [Anaerolineales bacterium]|nr:glycosyltransferase [Anaerolineales bacterium]